MKIDKFNTYTRMKRPDIEKFREVLRSSGGNITKVAAAFGVNRGTVYNWAKEDEEFRQSVKDERGLLVDECLASARMLALGIPERDSKGNFTGWLERPDGSMLCYLLSTLGRNEGFGEERQQQIDYAKLTDEQLDTLYSTGHCLGTGSFVPEERIKKDVNGSVPVITAPRRIGKGPVSAVLEAGKISDIPVVIHGTSSCGYNMLNEVSDERMNHIISDPEAFVSSGDNICCTGMTSDGAVFGGTSALQALLTELVKSKIKLKVSTV